ncbi:efflux RND transporter periplasmic adaptor subunit [Nibricoccus sp. IMCC34717]|uniref:efflux RND transporter periplasmic adaptor subunit n=1 Tax=Nibricoccus sp. IMCC34717 TaxID=3034021 RepID=UPI00384D91D2
MKPPPLWINALAGLMVGVVVVSLLPEATLFRGHDSIHPAIDATNGERWACPMMDFVGSKAGRCPVCGMTLVRVVAGEFNAEQVHRAAIATTRVTEGPATAQVRAYGIVEYDPRAIREVTARVSGRIVARHAATQGLAQEVSAGEPLLDLLSNDILSAQGELLSAQRLGDNALVAQVRSRFVRWGLEAEADAVLASGATRETVTLRSPYAGRVIPSGNAMRSAPVAEGREVMAGEVLLRLADNDRLLIVAQVPEARAHWVRPGQLARIASDDLGRLEAADAKIDQVALELSPATRTREIRISLAGVRGRLLPGSLVSVVVDASLDSTLHAADPAQPESAGVFALLPKTAVLSTGLRHIAWKVVERKADGALRFEPALLELGPRLERPEGNDLYVVRSGLAPGDEVVTQGAFLVDSQAQLAGSTSLLSERSSAHAPATHAH